jgi:hypothetical protein
VGFLVSGPANKSPLWDNLCNHSELVERFGECRGNSTQLSLGGSRTARGFRNAIEGYGPFGHKVLPPIMHFLTVNPHTTWRRYA